MRHRRALAAQETADSSRSEFATLAAIAMPARRWQEAVPEAMELPWTREPRRNRLPTSRDPLLLCHERTTELRGVRTHPMPLDHWRSAKPTHGQFRTSNKKAIEPQVRIPTKPATHSDR